MVIDTPAPVVIESSGGWYIRGDAGYVLNGSLEADYVTYGAPGGSNTLFGELENAYSFGGGIGYQVTKHLRADLTADYFSSAEFTGSTTGGPCLIGAVSVTNCVSTDSDAYSALSIMANAYVDIGNIRQDHPLCRRGHRRDPHQMGRAEKFRM